MLVGLNPTSSDKTDSITRYAELQLGLNPTSSDKTSTALEKAALMVLV